MVKKRKKKNDFVKYISRLLSSIGQTKIELKKLKNEELRKLDLKEREGIKLIKERTKQQKKIVVERYEKKKENLGKALLKRKSQELGKHLSIEMKSLSRTNKEIRRIKKDRRKK